MPPTGGNTHGNIVDGDVGQRRPHRRIIRRSTERMNPGNLEFERQVAAVEARQEQQRKEQQRQKQMCALLGLTFRAYLPYLNLLSDNHHVEDGEGQISWNNVFESPGPSAPLLLEPGTHQGKDKGLLKDLAKPPDTDFLEGTFLNINSGKQKSTRNKKSSKNKKKKGKGKGKGKRQSEPPTEPSSTCADAPGGESWASSSSHVAVELPLLEYSSSSSSSTVIKVITAAISSASSVNEKELSCSSNDDFKSFDSTTSYSTAASSYVNDDYAGGSAWNSTMGGSLSDARSERLLFASESIDSRHSNKRSDEGNQLNDRQSFSLAISSGGSLEGLLCSDYASNDGDFQKVISRKTAQKMKRMQRLESSTPSPTMAASVPTITHTVVQRTPRHEAITIGHFMKDGSIYSSQPNRKIKGTYQKGTGLRENVPGSTSIVLVPTEHLGKPGSSQMAMSSTSRHHVTLEVIDKTCSSGCLPMEGELKGPVHGGTKNKDPRAQYSYKTSSLPNSSSVDREEQNKAKAPVGANTEDTDSRAPTFDKSLSLVHLSNFSCIDREEQKKEENKLEFSTYASSEMDKINNAANDAYKIQAASDHVYMTCGIHADIETFLHSATPVIGQISCTTNDISLQDLCLWSVWSWYEEPECYGIEVEMQGIINSNWQKVSAYFVPSLSAVQLFEQSGKSGNKFGDPTEHCLLSPNHGGLFFEYFESENPFQRPPLFTKINHLLSGVSGNPIFGDPKKLKSVKLSNLHPASWYCVAWYPICQIPGAAGSCQAAFLTYHSLGKFVPQTYSTDMVDDLDRIICPIVGLFGYKDQREQPRSKATPNSSSETHPAELLNERLRTLRHGASIMSKALVPKGSGQVLNYHPDYEFFRSRSY